MRKMDTMKNRELKFAFFGVCALFGFWSCSDDNNIADIINLPFNSDLVEEYANSYENLMPFPSITVRESDLDDEDSYEFQEALVDELEDRGEVVSGYKLGFTGDSPRPFDAPEPLYGRLLSSQEFASGAQIDISDTFVAGAIGIELAIYIAQDASFETSDFPLSDAELLSLIDAVAPLSEMPDIAFVEGPDAVNYKDLIAANAGAKAYVVGERLALDDLTVGIDEIPVTVTVDGEEISQAISGDALGSQLEALEFLLRKLAEVGEGVEAGQIIATGSLGEDAMIAPGAYMLSYGGGLGELNFTLVE